MSARMHLLPSASRLVYGQFADAYLPVLDGVVRVVESYHRHLPSTLGVSYIVTPQMPGYQERDPRIIPVRSIPLHKPYRLSVPGLDRALYDRLDAIPFDVVHAHSPFVAGRLARLVTQERRIPLIFTLHTKFTELLRTTLHLPAAIPLMKRFLARYMRQCDVVIVPSRSMLQEARSYGPGLDHLTVVSNGIEFPEHATSAFDVRAAHAVPNDATLFLYVGQLIAEKQLFFLIEALEHLRRRRSDFCLLLVGAGPARHDLEREVERRGLREHCRFVGEIAARDRLFHYYHQADLFLFPSTYETQGLVVMEAASCGLPTVGRRGATGICDALVDGETGFFAENTPEEYAEIVRSIMDDRMMTRGVGDRARRQVVIRAADSTRMIETLYLNAIERRRGARPPHRWPGSRGASRPSPLPDAIAL